MKNKKIRLFILLLCVLVIVFILITIKESHKSEALTEQDIELSLEKDFPVLFSNLKENPELFGVSEKDLSGIKLLYPVRFVVISDGKVVGEKDPYILYLPMINDNQEIFSVYSILKNDNQISATIGIDFAPMLQGAKNFGITEAVLIQNNNILLLQGKEGILIDLNGNKITNDEELSSTMSWNELTANPYTVINLTQIHDIFSEKIEVKHPAFP